jgi:hypothetical protein
MKSERIPSLTTSVNNGQLLLLKPVDTEPLPLISGLLLLTLPLQTVPLPKKEKGVELLNQERRGDGTTSFIPYRVIEGWSCSLNERE